MREISLRTQISMFQCHPCFWRNIYMGERRYTLMFTFPSEGRGCHRLTGNVIIKCYSWSIFKSSCSVVRPIIPASRAGDSGSNPGRSILIISESNFKFYLNFKSCFSFHRFKNLRAVFCNGSCGLEPHKKFKKIKY